MKVGDYESLSLPRDMQREHHIAIKLPGIVVEVWNGFG